MELQLTLVFNGIVAGCVYLLFTAGFTLLFGTFRTVNLAQGAILVFGGFVGIFFDNTLKTPLIVSIVAAAVGAGLLTVVMDLVVLRPIGRAAAAGSPHQVGNDFGPMIVTLSFAAIIYAVLILLYGHESYSFTDAGWFLGPAFGIVSRLDIALLIVTALFVFALWFVINKTRAGARIRAVAEDRVMAAGVGVRPSLVSIATFFVAGALAGIGGVLIGVQYSNMNVAVGDSYLLIAFVIATVGGLGSLAGTAIASFIIGILQQVGGAHLSQPGVNLIIYGLLFLTLIVRPSGILGDKVLTQAVSRS
ncbi:branched-chain amino acid ABC transporter permease [Amycolatopsis sp. K13G38]|uniref:Branched-chain amino acid ABC transporter permease n=1 Tax=Amycolatopsis acididurans TaxID=2724524 RepID=A0ABX1JCL5_9PSEU|nr:branched-chain amino acid ABC transporter permease [Amycolatopsis acididurans]NKQ56161.1 branched-chain amino acid ABC transporter permease [Amycolatopsis acididurans]